MSRNSLLLALAVAPILLAAQTPTTDSKLDGGLSALLTKYSRQRATRGTIADTLHYGPEAYAAHEPLPTTLVVTDADAVVARIQADGHEATAVTATYVAAHLPLSYLPTLSDMTEVKRVSLARSFRPLMKTAREDTGVDRIQAGTGLKTPFTGKGVVLGVIDQGFQYNHIAFQDKDGKTRLRAIWDMTKSGTKPTEITNGVLPAAHDTYTKMTHATHVTNIAAGSVLNTPNELHGVAPEAEIIMIPSTFNNSDVAKAVKYVKDFAEKESKPWVVNMSFGSDIGPHDGMTDYDQAVSQLTGKGGFIAAAMGNENMLNLHASGVVSSDSTRYVFFDFDDKDKKDWITIDLWNQNTDGKPHLKITPLVYTNGTVEEKDEAYLAKVGSESPIYELSDISGKEHHQYFVRLDNIRTDLGKTAAKFGLKLELISGETQPQTVHLWTNVGYGVVSYVRLGKDTPLVLKGDNDYLVAEGAASIPTAISVGAYTAANTYYSYNAKTTYGWKSAEVGYKAPFSNNGPSLNPNPLYAKPVVTAPGVLVSSAFNAFDSSINKTSSNRITDVVNVGTTRYYYGVDSGTSMASPFVAGVLCLWLEANPHLDYAQVVDIIKKSSRRDEFFNITKLKADDPNEIWTKEMGYGRIDAYAGLKLALTTATAVERVSNSTTPVTFSMRPGEWRLLFNNAERTAHISVHALDGRLVETRHLSGVQQGQEEVIPLGHYAPGTYLLNIRTAATATTHRVLVR